MNRCKKLLCLALALIMALSLCTVAMADEVTTVNSIKFNFDSDAYKYGALNSVDGAVSITEVNGEAFTNSHPAAGAVVCESAAIYKGENVENPGALNLSADTTLLAGKNYYLAIVFQVYKEGATGINPAALAEDFGTSNLSLTGATTCTSAAWFGRDNSGKYYAIFELPALEAEEVSVAIPFVKKVELRDGSKAPGNTTFALELLQPTNTNVTVAGTVMVTGSGDYNGMITVKGDRIAVEEFIKNGFYVQEVNKGETGWEYDSQVWLVQSKNIRSAEVAKDLGKDTAETPEYNIIAKPAVYSPNGYHEDYNEKWCFGVTLTNYYTKNTVAPKPSKPATTVVEAPTTFDGGVALCAALSVLSMTGAVVVGKKRDK